jgi:hypothetical protein
MEVVKNALLDLSGVETKRACFLEKLSASGRGEQEQEATPEESRRVILKVRVKVVEAESMKVAVHLNFTLGALRQLIAEDQVIRHRAALPLVDGNHACQHLNGTIQKLRQKLSVVKLDRPTRDVDRVWSAFAAARYELNAIDGLQFRALCSSEKMALRPELVAALQRNPEKLKRSRCLYGVVNSYFSEWREMKDPVVVERLLTAVFAIYSGKNPVVAKWRQTEKILSAQAATLLATEICVGQKTVDDVLKSYYIGPLTKLARSIRDSSGKSAGERLHHLEGSRDNEWSLGYLQWMTESVLSDLTSQDSFCDAVSSLILSGSAKRSESFQRVRSYVQNHKKLGDPRIRESSLNWPGIAPEAAQRYLSWLARDSITFFFNTILTNNSENRRRKDFWLRYHAKIKDFQVAVSEVDVWTVKASKENAELLYYSHVAHPTTSAFMMKFEGYGGNFLVVEFSEKGNAAYIFRYDAFEAQGVTLRTHRFELKSHLKFDKAHRIIHNGDWEQAAAYMLSSEFGIRP